MRTRRLEPGQSCVHCGEWTRQVVCSTYWMPVCEDCRLVLLNAREIKRAMSERRRDTRRKRRDFPDVVFL